ncbi:MAG: DMT family transporter [Defluviitaleaceae bacterium]|nr:DMT family transporter [Defluviitaleaceae bacterium]
MRRVSKEGSREFRYSLVLFATAVIWGVAFVAQRAGMDYVGAFTFNGVRFLLGALVLVPVCFFLEWRKERPEQLKKIRTSVSAGFIGGLVLFVAAGLQQLGVQLTMSAGKAGFITGLYIVLTPVLGIFIGKKTGVFTWAGAFVACAGLYLLSAPDGIKSVGAGDVLLVACAFFWAAHILLVDNYAGAGRIYPVMFSIVQFVVCGALSLAFAFALEDVALGAIFSGYVPILYSSVFSVGLAYTLQIVGQRHVGPAKAALIFSTESLFAAIGAAVLIGEIMGGRSYAGCAIIFAGIIVSQLRKKTPQGGAA